MATAKPVTPTTVILIGLSTSMVDALSQSFSQTIVSAPAPFLGKRADGMTDEDWATYCRDTFEASVTAESGAIAQATYALVVDPQHVTVIADASAFGYRASDGKWAAYPAISDPESWRQVGMLARANGATVRVLTQQITPTHGPRGPVDERVREHA